MKQINHLTDELTRSIEGKKQFQFFGRVYDIFKENSNQTFWIGYKYNFRGEREKDKPTVMMTSEGKAWLLEEGELENLKNMPSVEAKAAKSEPWTDTLEMSAEEQEKVRASIQSIISRRERKYMRVSVDAKRITLTLPSAMCSDRWRCDEKRYRRLTGKCEISKESPICHLGMYDADALQECLDMFPQKRFVLQGKLF